MIRILLLAVFALLCCCEREKEPVQKKQPDVILSADLAGRLGYKIRENRRVVQSQWDENNFGKALIIEQDIKALKPMVGRDDLFPRFTLIRETYEDEDSAKQRVLRLRDFDPKFDDKTKLHAGLVLRQGFASGQKVIIVTTDAAVFSYDELPSLAEELEVLFNG